jgi:hypothetical protein
VKKLEKTKELVLKLEGKLEKLTDHGFVKREVTRSNINEIFVHPKKRVVVKRPYLTECGRQDKLPLFAVPTVAIRLPDPEVDLELDMIFIQPLVDVRDDSRHNAMSQLSEHEAAGAYFTDLRSANCGLYRRQPVVFDW